MNLVWIPQRVPEYWSAPVVLDESQSQSQSQSGSNDRTRGIVDFTDDNLDYDQPSGSRYFTQNSSSSHTSSSTTDGDRESRLYNKASNGHDSDAPSTSKYFSRDELFETSSSFDSHEASKAKSETTSRYDHEPWASTSAQRENTANVRGRDEDLSKAERVANIVKDIRAMEAVPYGRKHGAEDRRKRRAEDTERELGGDRKRVKREGNHAVSSWGGETKFEVSRIFLL
jgi:hypothetical protein